MLLKFDEQDQKALRILGFSIDNTPNGELAELRGEMKLEIWRSDNDQLALMITLPAGGEITAMIPHSTLHGATED
jgi:hypothetical protein